MSLSDKFKLSVFIVFQTTNQMNSEMTNSRENKENAFAAYKVAIKVA
jgi:hypothetical protein